MRTTSRNEFLENPTNGIFQFFDKLKKWNKFKEMTWNICCSIDFIMFIHIK